MTQDGPAEVTSAGTTHTQEHDVGRTLLAALGMLGRRKGTMPLRSFSNIPVFKGMGVGSFLDRYNTVADDFDVPAEGRVKGLIHYLSEDPEKNILQYVKSLPEWKDQNWSGIQEILRRTFPDDARETVKYTISDLRNIINSEKPMQDMRQLADYYFRYKLVADYLYDTEEITRKEHGSYFFKGLPSHVRYALEAKEKAASGGVRSTLTVEQTYLDCQALFRNEGAYTVANGRYEREDNVISVPRTHVPVIPAVLPARTESISGGSSEMAALLRMFEDLKVEFTQIRADLKERPQQASRYQGNGYNNSGNSYANSGRPSNYSGNGPATGANNTPIPAGRDRYANRPCPYDGCEKKKQDCEALKEDLRKGLVQAESLTGHLLYPDGSRIPFIAGQMIGLVRSKTQALEMQNIEIRSYSPPAVSAPDVPFINHIGRQTRVSFEDDHEVEAQEKRPMEDSDREQGREVRRPRMQIPEVVIESRVPQASRTGPLAPLPARGNQGNQNNPQASTSRAPGSSSQTRTTRPVEPARDEDLADDESDDFREETIRSRGTVQKRMPGSTLWAPINEKVGHHDEIVGTLIDQILKTDIHIPIGSMLSLSKDASKRLNDVLHRKRVPVPTSRPYNVRHAEVNDAGSFAVEDGDIPEASPYEESLPVSPLYTHAIGRVKVKLNGLDLTAIVDTGSEINVMPRRTWARLGCHLREDGRHMMVSANSTPTQLLGIAEDLDLTLGQLRTTAHFFVTGKATWDLLIGMPLLSHLRAKIWFENSCLWLRLTDDEGHVIKIRSTMASDARNKSHVPAYSPHPVVAIAQLYQQENSTFCSSSSSPTTLIPISSTPTATTERRFTEVVDDQSDMVTTRSQTRSQKAEAAKEIPDITTDDETMSDDSGDFLLTYEDEDNEFTDCGLDTGTSDDTVLGWELPETRPDHTGWTPTNETPAIKKTDSGNDTEDTDMTDDEHDELRSDASGETEILDIPVPPESSYATNYTAAEGWYVLRGLLDRTDSERKIEEKESEKGTPEMPISVVAPRGMPEAAPEETEDYFGPIASPVRPPLVRSTLNPRAETFYPLTVYPETHRVIPRHIYKPSEIKDAFPTMTTITPCHFNGDDYTILRDTDMENVLLDNINVGKAKFIFHYDTVIVSAKAALAIGRKAYELSEDAPRKVRVLSAVAGEWHEIDVLDVMPSVTIGIGDAYETTTDVLVVGEVDETYTFDILVGSLVLLKPDIVNGRRCIGHEIDGKFHVHRKNILDRLVIPKSLTNCVSELYDFGGDRRISTTEKLTVKTSTGCTNKVGWAFMAKAKRSYISERALQTMYCDFKFLPHITDTFQDDLAEYRVKVIGTIEIEIYIGRAISGHVTFAVTRGNMPEDIVISGDEMLKMKDDDNENILIDSPVGRADVRYSVLHAFGEVWISRGNGVMQFVHFAGSPSVIPDLTEADLVGDSARDSRLNVQTQDISATSIPTQHLIYLSALPFFHNFHPFCYRYCNHPYNYSRMYSEAGQLLGQLSLNSQSDSSCPEIKDISESVIAGGSESYPVVPEMAQLPETDVKERQKEYSVFQAAEVTCETKYKPVAKKVKPLNIPLPEKYSTGRFFRPEMKRDLYKTPLDAHPPAFVPGGRLTEDRIALMHFGPEGWISDEEKKLLLHVLRLREKALAFDKSEKGCLKPSYASDYVIPIVEHTPWQDKSIPIPKALYPKIIDLLKEEIAAGDLEPSYAPYCTRWFVVQKKDGRIRKVDSAESLNRITIKDSGIPPNVEDFQMGFTGRVCYSLADMISGYDQRRLAIESRDLTTIRTPLGLLRRTRLPQGYTNAVAEYQRTMTHVLAEEVPDTADVFIDDVGIKGPKSDYGGETIPGNPGIRRWVWEHAVNLERILARLEEAGLTASGKKFVVIAPALEIIGTVISKEGRRISRDKLNKIAAWPNPCPNVTSLRGFLGLVGFVRPFVKNFALDDYPLRKLLEKKRKWLWTEEASRAMDALKKTVGDSGILHKIDYTSGREIIMAVDSSNIATGIALYQMAEDGETRLPIRFESLGFNDRESRYSQPKLELCGVYKALRKLRQHVFGVKFTLEVDARSIIQMLNAPELPNAPMTRWISFIRLFDFDLKHVAAKNHTIPDALSRKERTFDDDEPFDADDAADEDLDVWTTTLSFPEGEERCQVLPVPNRVWLMEELYDCEPEWLALARFLNSGEIDGRIPAEERRNILRRAPAFFLRNGKLFRRCKKGVPQEVILKPEIRIEILEELHEKSGHRGRDAVLAHVKDRFWWPRMYDSIKEHVRSCDQCQRRHNRREKEPSRATVPSRLFQKVGIDLVHLGEGSGPFPYMVVARDDLSNWVEAREIRNKYALTIRKFIEQDIVCRYGPVLEWITTDGGGETRRETAAYLKKLHIPIVRSTPYHPQANGMIERGHGPLVEACLKMAGARKTEWHRYLPTALWADRITTRRTTGKAPFEVLFGAAPLLPIDIEFETWLFTEWTTVRNRAQLLEARMRQIERRDEDMLIAVRKLAESRERSVEYLDRKMAHRLRKPLKPGDYVLQHDTKLTKQWSHRVKDRWFGPFVIEGQHTRGSYYLREVDGTPRPIPVSANRLRRFFPRGQRLRDEDYVEGDFDDFEDPPAPVDRRQTRQDAIGNEQEGLVEVDEQDDNDEFVEAPERQPFDFQEYFRQPAAPVQRPEPVAARFQPSKVTNRRAGAKTSRIRQADIPAELEDDELDAWADFNEEARRRHYPLDSDDDEEDSVTVAPRKLAVAFEPIHEIDFRKRAEDMRAQRNRATQ